MATSVGLNFRLTAAVENFEKSMSEVNKKLGQIEKSSKQTATGMKLLAGIEVGKLLLKGLSQLYGMLKSGVSTLVSWSKQVSALADSIGKLSDATGMAEEPLQVFQQLANYNGISSDKLGEAVKRMTKRLAEAKMGFGEALPALERLGLNVDELASMKPEQAFLKIGNAIGQLPQKGEQAAAAFKIFSDQGLAMVPMFKDMEKNAKATADEMLSLGQILSGSQIDAIESMNDSFTKVFSTAKKIGAQVLAAFAPAIQEANERLLEFVQNFQFKGRTGGQAFVSYVVQAFAEATKILLDWAERFAQALVDVGAVFMRAAEFFLSAADTLTKYLPGPGPEHELGGGGGGGGWGDEDGPARLLDRLADSAGAAADALSATEVDFSTLRGTLDTVGASVESFGSESDSTAAILAGFFDDAKLYQFEAMVKAATAAKDAFVSLGDYLPSFEQVAGKTADAIGQLGDPSKVVKSSLDYLNDAAVNVAFRFGITRKQIEDFGATLSYSKSLTAQFGETAGSFTQALSNALANGPTAVVNGLNSLAGGLLSVLEPLGYTRDKIIQLGRAAEAHKNFKQTLIDNAMSDWDSVAKQRLQYYIKQGANPFAAFHEMYKQRNAMLEQVTKKANEAENKWIQATGGLTGQMEITTEGVKAAGEKLGEKLADAGEAAMEAFEGVKDFFGGMFDGSGDGVMPELEELKPELERQTSTLDGILDAAKGFGANFVLASF